MTFLAIFLGGGIGSLLRFFTTRLGNNLGAGTLPYGTILSNVIACGLLAVFILILKNQIRESSFISNFLLIGLCGGYSTFSTFSYETVSLVNSGQWGVALANVLISVVVCFVLIMLILKA